MHMAITMHMGRIIIPLRLKLMVHSPKNRLFTGLFRIIAPEGNVVKCYFFIDGVPATTVNKRKKKMLTAVG